MCFTALELSVSAQTQKIQEGPDGSNFWQVPPQTPATARRGDILWARPRSDAPEGSHGWNLIYVSESAEGKLAYVSGEIYIPDSVPANGEARRLLVWDHGAAGLQDA